MLKIDFINAVNKFEYIVNMMCREKILLMQKHILSMQKNRFDYCEIQTQKSIQILRLNFKNTISLAILWESSEQFLNNEQKIIYAEKRVNNFLNNDEQKIILYKMLEIVYAETVNNFYEKTMNGFS